MTFCPFRGAHYLQQCEGYSRLCTCVMVFTCGVLQRKVECAVEEMHVKTAEIESVLKELEQHQRWTWTRQWWGPMWCLISE